MAREVRDEEKGITWTCTEAYAGLGGSGGEAAKADDGRRFRVVCTPSGGARSVELELPGGWEDSMEDAELVRRIRAGLEEVEAEQAR